MTCICAPTDDRRLIVSYCLAESLIIAGAKSSDNASSAHDASPGSPDIVHPPLGVAQIATIKQIEFAQPLRVTERLEHQIWLQPRDRCELDGRIPARRRWPGDGHPRRMCRREREVRSEPTARHQCEQHDRIRPFVERNRQIAPVTTEHRRRPASERHTVKDAIDHVHARVARDPASPQQSSALNAQHGRTR